MLHSSACRSGTFHTIRQSKLIRMLNARQMQDKLAAIVMAQTVFAI